MLALKRTGLEDELVLRLAIRLVINEVDLVQLICLWIDGQYKTLAIDLAPPPSNRRAVK
jgi:hypothetical protein